MAANKKKPAKIVTHPYLTGSPVDSRSLKSALSLFVTYLIITLLYLVVASVLLMDTPWIRIALCVAVLAMTWLMLFLSGQSRGTDAVDYGEKLWLRQEKGVIVEEKERKLCYHPLKGFVQAFMGVIPFFLCALALSATATLQRTGLTPLPSWLSSYEAQEEIGKPLAFYHVSSGLSLEGILRLIIRLHLMPWVSLFNSANASAMLTMERISPLLTLIAPVFYGIGYTRGVAVRTQVHTAIAANDRKRRNVQKKQIRARRAARQPRQPEQLN